MEVLIAVVIIAVVAAFVSVPLCAAGENVGPAPEDPVLAELEARKQSKYREIRDTELDRAQGKIGEAEYKRQHAELRAEAIAILKQIDAAEASSDGPGPASV